MVTRAEFVKAIKAFKKDYRGKLKELLDKDSNPSALDAFWANPIIHEYLSRPSITFVDQHPELHDSKSKEEHDNTDHYELKVYQYLPDDVAYRKKNILSSEFYLLGTDRQLKIFSTLFSTMCQKTNDIKIDGPMDIYNIARMATRMFLEPKAGGFPRFLLHANWKDDHASSLLTILDKSTGRALITLFINSWQGQYYYDYIKERFLLKQQFCLRLQSLPQDQTNALEPIKEYLSTTFSVNIDEPLSPEIDLTNEVEKATFKTNSKTQKSPEIETVYTFDSAKKMLQVSHTPKTLFIDASLDLQKEKSDQNCALYSFNFIEAIAKMLQKPEEADRVYQLACSLKSNPDALDDLVRIFQSDLKAYLPCYYDSVTKEAKSPAEREVFHLNQRWEIGRQSISIRHPLEQPSSAASDPLATEKAKVNEASHATVSESGFFAVTDRVTTQPESDRPRETQKDEQSAMLSPS